MFGRTSSYVVVGAVGFLGVVSAGCEVGGEIACESAHAIGEGPDGTLLVTTTDFSTGWLSVVDVHERSVEADVALSSTDAIPFVHEDRVFLVHRHGYDFIDMLEFGDEWSAMASYPVETSTGAGANPQAVAFASDGLGYVTIYGAPELVTIDFDSPPSSASQGRIDLSEFADADGTPEAGLAIAHGEQVFVTLQRLDSESGFVRVDDDVLVVVDTESRELVDLDPLTPATDGLTLPGQWPRQWRWDGRDPASGRVLMLTTGILRVDLEQVAWSWAVDPAEFEAAGIAERLLPQSFDLDSHGNYWVAAYTSDFDSVRIFRGRPGEGLVEVADGLQSVERTLSVVGSELWFGDTTIGAAGMRGYAIVDGVELAPLAEIPLCTGLDPYSVRRVSP